MASKTISVSEIFDSSRFTPYQVRVCLLCFVVTFLDGFDLTVIGVALPKIADFLHSKPSALGLALSAGQFGPLIGAIILGSLADRWGRKWMLFWSALIFGVFTFATAFITSVGELALYRFIAGIGLGGAVPNALAFGSEYAPSRRRSTVVASMYAGMPAGAMMGALAAVFLLPYYDWQSLFLLGGAVPILIGIVLIVLLPESIEFMVRRGKDKAKVLKIVRKIAPQLASDDAVEFRATGEKLPGVPVKHLFTQKRAMITIFLWLALIGSLYSLWILTSWAPTLLKKTGATVQQYSLAFACLHFGAFIATVTIGRLMDKFNPYRVLQVGFVLGALSLAAFGVSAGGSFIIIAILSILCGALINGSNGCLLAVATLAYPPSIRGSGIGWAYAIAKIGAMLAPAVGGMLLGWNWTVAAICGIQSLVGLAVAGLVLALQRRVASVAGQDENKPLQDEGTVGEAA